MPTARLSDSALPDLDAITSWPGRTVEMAGQELFVRTTDSDGADAEPALCVHGLGGASTNWTDLAALLRRELAIEAIDLPGFGRSGPARNDDYSLGAHARAVITYLGHRRDEVSDVEADILRLAARAEYDGDPPEVVEEWLADQGVSL